MSNSNFLLVEGIIDASQMLCRSSVTMIAIVVKFCNYVLKSIGKFCSSILWPLRDQVVDPADGRLNPGLTCFLFSFILIVNWTLLQVRLAHSPSISSSLQQFMSVHLLLGSILFTASDYSIWPFHWLCMIWSSIAISFCPFSSQKMVCFSLSEK